MAPDRTESRGWRNLSADIRGYLLDGMELEAFMTPTLLECIIAGPESPQGDLIKDFVSGG